MYSFFRLGALGYTVLLLVEFLFSLTSFAWQEEKEACEKTIETDSSRTELLLKINQEIQKRQSDSRETVAG
jgi:hypothetical protein